MTRRPLRAPATTTARWLSAAFPREVGPVTVEYDWRLYSGSSCTPDSPSCGRTWSLPWLCSRTTPSARVVWTSSPGAGSASTRSGPSLGAGSSVAVHSGWPSGASSETKALVAQYGEAGAE